MTAILLVGYFAMLAVVAWEIVHAPERDDW